MGVVGAMDCVSYSTGPGEPIIGGSYAFIVLSDRRALALAPPSLAMAKGGGLRRMSGEGAALMVEAVEIMLEAERFLLWPLLWPPVLPSVFARDRFPGGLTLSVRICLWNLVPVAASDSEGMSSLT